MSRIESRLRGIILRKEQKKSHTEQTSIVPSKNMRTNHFNPKTPNIVHIDINSCFATIEQQANPNLRGKPVVVAAYPTPRGCILAASVEAKKFGIRTGMRVGDGQKLFKNLIVLPPDPPKYRYVHLKLRELLNSYTDKVIPKSIDEFVLNFENTPNNTIFNNPSGTIASGKNSTITTNIYLLNIARNIKERIKNEIGEYITVSIGLGPNRFLAKTASNLQKPNGLNEININNYLSVYEKLELTDLCGIAERNSLRLKTHGINSVVDFYNADISKLKRAFASINGYYWYLRLHGWEADDTESTRQSFGNSYALPNRLANVHDLAPILYKLVVKTGKRLRSAEYKTTGIHVALSYCDGTYWHKGHLVGTTLYDSHDIYNEAYKLLCESPSSKKPVAIISEYCYGLIKSNQDQLNMFYDTKRKDKLVKSIDKITDKWGEFTIVPATMISVKQHVHDRISFGGIKDLQGNLASAQV